MMCWVEYAQEKLELLLFLPICIKIGRIICWYDNYSDSTCRPPSIRSKLISDYPFDNSKKQHIPNFKMTFQGELIFEHINSDLDFLQIF